MSEKIKGKIKASSEKAIMIKIISNNELNGKEIWIPKSQIEWEENYTIEILVSDFIANAKGFILDDEFQSRRGTNQSSDSEVPF